jgi:NifU-like protein involved in Fe-S cluster formation
MRPAKIPAEVPCLNESYSPVAIQHFMNPQNTGALEPADGRGCSMNLDFEDYIKVSIRVSHERLTEVRFRAAGSPAIVACGSALTELAAGLPLEEAQELTAADLNEALEGLPELRRYCCELCLRAFRAALLDHEQRHRLAPFDRPRDPRLQSLVTAI